MEFGIRHLNKCDGRKCDRCGKDITGFGFGVDSWENVDSPKTEHDRLFQNRQYYQHAILCCPECAGLITGEDTEERIRVREEYDGRIQDFLNTPWNPTSNPLVVVKVWKGQHVSVMRDKFGQRKFGVLFGKSERWNTRERHHYERNEQTAIRDMRTAEYIAFCWVDFVLYYAVRPEAPYTVDDFRRLAANFSIGVLPDKAAMQTRNWWEL